MSPPNAGNSRTARPVPLFRPRRIILAKGSDTTQRRKDLADSIRAAYPDAQVITAYDTPHNSIRLGKVSPLLRVLRGKKTLVLAEHKTAVKLSEESGNTCPNYWHFSPYGFCPYFCDYCYLAGSQGVWFSPAVKVFLNLPEIMQQIDFEANRIAKPAAFYVGKLQDGLALDPLTNYSRELVPFFAEHHYARMTLLTKSDSVDNLLGLDHQGHCILSWSVNPPEITERFESRTPSIEARISAMQRCAEAGYPVRVVVMPIIPVADWQRIYEKFLRSLVEQVPLCRITLGSICSYGQALKLTELRRGEDNMISSNVAGPCRQCSDRRARFPYDMRRQIYRSLVHCLHEVRPLLQTGLCLEASSMLDALDKRVHFGQCNCVL